ncbi:MAG: hypothetical protein JXA37_10940 [Chloroflexia bacterium]|nr:hypothetical protein [Chloroflexia bacterium]
MAKKLLFIGGSINQTSIAHAVARHLQDDYECSFTPYYCDAPPLNLCHKLGLLEFSVAGRKLQRLAVDYIQEHNLRLDYAGQTHDYDLVVTTSDLVIQRNIRDKPIVLVQEGMTDPENLMYHLVRWFRLPRYLASTSTTGLSDAYKVFCVASAGYKKLFVRKGVKEDKIVVTGLPNFDDAAQYMDNDFPYRDYVLVATSDARETFKWENRKKFIRESLDIAAGRPLLFKLHPNENAERAFREIKRLAPHALVLAKGNMNHMIANCQALITQYSSVIYVGLALGKEVYSYFDLQMLREMMPLQNGGTSGRNIAAVCRQILENGHNSPRRAT